MKAGWCAHTSVNNDTITLVHRIVLMAIASLMVGCGSSGGSSNRSNGVDEKLKHAADVYTELAMGYMEKGQYQVALEKIESALEANSESPEANTVAAVLNERVGRLDLAETFYAYAVKLNPRDGRMQNNLGQFLCNHGRTEISIQHFERAVQDPFYKTPTIALTNMGACQEKLQQLEAAEHSYRTAIDMDATFPDVLYRLSRLMCNQENFFNARAFLQRYLFVAPEGPESLYLCYRIESGLASTETAQECLDSLMNTYPASPLTQKVNESSDNNLLCQ